MAPSPLAPAASMQGTANPLGFGLTMAFQPIVDLRRQAVFAYEALARGTEGASTAEVLHRITTANIYVFDHFCRVRAIELATRLGIASRGAFLTMNLLPSAVYSPAASLRRTLEIARQHGFPSSALLFEIAGNEPTVSIAHLREMACVYAREGLRLALDDVNSGSAGLNLLAEIEGLSLLKIDAGLVRDIHRRPRAQSIVAALLTLCQELEVRICAECVETVEECHALEGLGVELMQGFLFARPAWESLPEIAWPGPAPALARTGVLPQLGLTRPYPESLPF